MMQSLRSLRRVKDPQEHYPPAKTLLSEHGELLSLKLNVFYQHKKPSLCMSNCRSIEVSVIYPLVPTSSPSNPKSNLETDFSETFPETQIDEMLADQERSADPDLSLTLIESNLSREPPPSSASQPFRFQDLPLELRLKIYAYLLPARAHTIVTQIPHNGYFYNTATIPQHSAQSFYPFGRSPPKNLTTYKVLTENFRSEFPAPSICPEILRVSRAVHEEAEPVLYGSKSVSWDFGVHLEALVAFWRDRSKGARAAVKEVRIAREIPVVKNGEEVVSGVDARWRTLCDFLRDEMTGLRELNLTIWSSSGIASAFPSVGAVVDADDEESKMLVRKDEEKRWREWEWTKELLQMEALRNAKVNWWGFPTTKGDERQTVGFDSWLAGRMVGDKLMRARMVEQGVVVEGSVVLPGRTA